MKLEEKLRPAAKLEVIRRLLAPIVGYNDSERPIYGEPLISKEEGLALLNATDDEFFLILEEFKESKKWEGT